jgi:hypothetical protein
MEYELLLPEEKIKIINERILDLERHIFHNETLLLENESIGLFDEESVVSMNTQNSRYTQQILVLGQIRDSINQ